MGTWDPTNIKPDFGLPFELVILNEEKSWIRLELEGRPDNEFIKLAADLKRKRFFPLRAFTADENISSWTEDSASTTTNWLEERLIK